MCVRHNRGRTRALDKSVGCDAPPTLMSLHGDPNLKCDSQRSGRNNASIIATALLAIAVATSVSEAKSTPSIDETYLDALRGTWDMPGTFGGRPIRYSAQGQRVLQGGFVRLHMIDASSPPQYEADVFIGFDPKANDYVAHWLDRFGAAGARVVGRGVRDGERLVITFPYAEGAFRDTFIRQPTTRSWSLLLESQAVDGTWSTFASYTLARRAKD